MIKGGKGGKRTFSGLRFEKKVDIISAFRQHPSYVVKKVSKKGANSHSYQLFFAEKLVAEIYQKNSFYWLLESKGIKWKDRISSKLLPDNAIWAIIQNTLFIIEVKYQITPGSTDEKLQTCDFKRRQYLKLVRDSGLKVAYVYVLNDWFKKDRYRDVLDYIETVGCFYYFNEIPFEHLGLHE